MSNNKEEAITMDGIVVLPLPNARFEIKLENDHTIIAYVSGKIRTNKIKIARGDKVKIEMSPYDMTKGRITYRY